MISYVGVGLLLTAGHQQVAFLPAGSVRARGLDVDDGSEATSTEIAPGQMTVCG